MENSDYNQQEPNEFILTSESKINESIKEELAKLPFQVQLAINSFGWLKKCQQIGESFCLTENEIHNFKVEVALVILGLSNMDALHEFLDTEIGGTGWEKIEGLVTEQILGPLLDLIELLEQYDVTTPIYCFFEDIYTLDLPVFLGNSTFTGTRQLHNSELTMKYYECALDRTFLTAFDIIRIGFIWEEKEIKLGATPLEIKLLPKSKKLNEKQIGFMIDSIVQSCVRKDEDYLFDARRFKGGTCPFMLLDHPNGHDIGIHQSDDPGYGISLDINITYEDFLKFREKYLFN